MEDKRGPVAGRSPREPHSANLGVPGGQRHDDDDL